MSSSIRAKVLRRSEPLKVEILILRLNLFFQFLEIPTNESLTMHLTICTWIALEINNNYDQQFNRHDFLIKFNLNI